VHNRLVQTVLTEYDEPSWLYRIAGICALLLIAIFILQIVVFIKWPAPQSVEAQFAVLQRDPLLGLLQLDMLLVIDELLELPIALAFFFALRRRHEAVAFSAMILSFTAITLMLVARPGLEMLHLSRQLAAAASDAQRAALLSAGKAVFSTFNGTAFHSSYVIGSIAMLLFALAMFGEKAFGRVMAWIGIVSSLLGFALYIPRVGIPLAILSALGVQVWNMLIARALWGMSREQASAESPHCEHLFTNP